MSFGPFVRLVHDYPQVTQFAGREISQRSIADHALHYFKQGRGTYILDGKEYQIHAGMIFIVRAGSSFCFKLDKGKKHHMLNIHFDLIEAPDSFFSHPYPANKRTHKVQVLPSDFGCAVKIINKADFESVFQELQSVFLLEGSSWDLKKKSLMLEILRVIYDNASSSNSKTIIGHRVAIQKSIEYIQRHISRKISLDELVKNSGMCRALFIRTFKNECGLSPIKFVYKAKIEKARAMFAEPDKSVKQVAVELGFADVYHFSRIFKEITNMPPGKYRQFILDNQIK